MPTATQNRSELALFRTKKSPEALAEWIKAFGEGDASLASRYALAVATFLGEETPDERESYLGKLSPRTRKVYSFAITEFFEWIARARGRVVPPHKVAQKDAEDYANWLATRPFSLDEEKLKDGDEPVRLALYETVKRLGQPDVIAIAKALPRDARRPFATKDEAIASIPIGGDRVGLRALHAELGRMVLHDFLVRTPTLEALREDDPRLGIDRFTIAVPEGNTTRLIDFEYIFQYSVPVPRAVSRATISLRLTALSSFWNVLAQGENVPGGKAILQYNVFDPIKRRVQRGLAPEKRQASALAHQLTADLMSRLLEVADGPRLSDKRDAALLWFLVLTGARVSEATAIRRGLPPGADQNRWPGWFDASAEPPVVVLRRKGGKMQRLPFPPLALKALYGFQEELSRRAAPATAQHAEPGSRGYIPQDSPRWRFELLQRDDAPLLPPVSFWGANTTANYEPLRPNLPASRARGIDYRRSMSNSAVDRMLKRIARRAGLVEADVAKVHAHAIRAFAATAMVRMGKPLTEVQAILGHESVTTTERYIADEDRLVTLSGQAEILGYISQREAGVPKAREAPPPPAPAPVPIAPPRRPIETRGVPVPEEAPPVRERRPTRPERPSRPERPPPAPAPTLVRPVVPEKPEYMPAASPVLPEAGVVPHATSEGPIVEVRGEPLPAAATEVREGLSPGSPVDVYASLEPTPTLSMPERVERQERIAFTRVNPRRPADKKLATLYAKSGREQVQQDHWLRDHYDPWPLHYGIGEGSLLAWYARGNPRTNGEVETNVLDPETGKEKTVRVPPLPVLAPDQVYPEVVRPAGLLPKLEALSRRWMTTEPSKVFGLRRWFATLAFITARLERDTGEKYEWVPFDGVAKRGEDLRAHSDEYLEKWLEENAGRYMTTVRIFKAEMRRAPSDAGPAEDFMQAFERATFESVSQVEEIPGWFMLDDPIREIYDKSPEEWDYFVTWIRSVTGAKLSREREENRGDQVVFAEEQREAEIEDARSVLRQYFEMVNALASAMEENDRAQVRFYTAMLHGGAIGGKQVEGLDERLKRLGLRDPKEYAAVPEQEQRIEKILADAFPEAPVELVDPNMLRSELFDPEGFRIDPRGKTIRHTKEFRAAFAERYERDSECVMRRAARGMWEYVKRSGDIKIEPGRRRASQYAMLHAVMLSYIAWIIPCPEDIEKRMAPAAPKKTTAYLRAMNAAVKDALRGDPERTEDDVVAEAEREFNLPAEEAERAFDIAGVIAATLAERAVPIEQAVGDALRREELRKVHEPGARPRRRVLRRNASGKVALFAPDESLTVLYEWEDRYVSPEICRRAAELIPNAPRVFPDPLRMIAAMLVEPT